MEERKEELAAQLDCFTERDLIMLTDAAPATVETWRKRGIGPAYTRVGKTVLYPRAAVREWLESRVRAPKNVPAADLL